MIGSSKFLLILSSDREVSFTLLSKNRLLTSSRFSSLNVESLRVETPPPKGTPEVDVCRTSSHPVNKVVCFLKKIVHHVGAVLACHSSY